uniref:Predicted protein n=1 Tax=Hordeum vulgare subsp. vulgare TaxID=112509 RepID=F2DFG5_HORVV|nr:predicted protein [Hordeum vulgare subsp. vulgare]
MKTLIVVVFVALSLTITVVGQTVCTSWDGTALQDYNEIYITQPDLGMYMGIGLLQAKKPDGSQIGADAFVFGGWQSTRSFIVTDLTAWGNGGQKGILRNYEGKGYCYLDPVTKALVSPVLPCEWSIGFEPTNNGDNTFRLYAVNGATTYQLSVNYNPTVLANYPYFLLGNIGGSYTKFQMTVCKTPFIVPSFMTARTDYSNSVVTWETYPTLMPVTCTPPSGTRFNSNTFSVVSCTSPSLQVTKTFGVTITSRYTGEYMGCYVDKPARDFNESSLYTTQTVDYCVIACGINGFSYAAIQNGNECRCGKSYGSYGRSNICTTRCPGNSNEFCGGPWANSVYAVYDKSTQYMGCYFDSSDRDLPIYYGESTTRTPANCIAGCKSLNYQYAGLQNYKECWCGNSFGRFGSTHNSNCKYGCTGNPHGPERCGGAWMNSIYKTN